MPDHFGRVQFVPAHHWIAGIVMLVLFAVLIGVIIWAVVRITRTEAMKRAPALTGPPPPPVAPASAEDAALATLRMRYARGEIDRDEYLRVAADLGLAPPPEAS